MRTGNPFATRRCQHDAVPALADLNPIEQLRAGRLPRRLVQLVVGLWLFGAAEALIVTSGLGNAPWDVFHQGVATLTGLSMGTVMIITGAVVLLLWVPLRQWPGLGTVANTILIGLSLDWTLHIVPAVDGAAWRTALMVAGVILNGLGGGLYIGAQLGPGPRDGLMTGLDQRTGVSMRFARTGVEVAVVLIGWALGGTVGVGTMVYALAIGPLTQAFLGPCVVELRKT